MGIKREKNCGKGITGSGLSGLSIYTEQTKVEWLHKTEGVKGVRVYIR